MPDFSSSSTHETRFPPSEDCCIGPKQVNAQESLQLATELVQKAAEQPSSSQDL